VHGDGATSCTGLERQHAACCLGFARARRHQDLKIMLSDRFYIRSRPGAKGKKGYNSPSDLLEGHRPRHLYVGRSDADRLPVLLVPIERLWTQRSTNIDHRASQISESEHRECDATSPLRTSLNPQPHRCVILQISLSSTNASFRGARIVEPECPPHNPGGYGFPVLSPRLLGPRKTRCVAAPGWQHVRPSLSD